MYIHWDSCLDSGRNELLFENRNRQFGAYVIRRDYSKNLLFAFLVTCCMMGGLIMYIYIVPLSNVPAAIKEIPDDPYKFIDYVIPPVDPVTDFKQPESSGKPVTDELVNPVVVKQDYHEVIVPAPTGTAANQNTVLPGTDPGPETGIENPATGIPNTISNPAPRKYVENMPIFPGGEEALVKYLSSRIRYPEDARRKKIQGTVYLSFVVDAAGKVSQVKILHGIFPDCDEVAVKAVSTMPDWTPGNQNGQNVSVEMNLPVNFTLR